MTEPRVYVGTYAKYNNGSIAGKWLTLSDYADREDFYEACKELHKDEADPELMFQDYEGFPRSMYCESSVSEELIEFANLDDDDRELLSVYRENIQDGNIEAAKEAYRGKYRSEADFAAEWLEETGGLEGVPKHLENYIDFEAYARDMRMNGEVSFVHHDGDLWVFMNY